MKVRSKIRRGTQKPEMHPNPPPPFFLLPSAFILV
jgi:hypothetical protein